jgi:hypothetical protein
MTGMNGQWMGRYTGSNSGTLVIDLDDRGAYYEGRAYVYEDNQALPSTVALIKTQDKANTCRLTLPVYPIDPRTGDQTSWNQLASFFPTITFPAFAEVVLDYDNVLKVSWATNTKTTGSAELAKSRAGEPTEYKPLSEVTNWKQFKEYVNELEHRSYIFRGQRRTLRLRTGFHRTGRADLVRFLENDIQTLHRHLSQRTSHIFNLSIPNENGAFFNLVQHHGYPTPLLDWTFSPYVGAFFAYQHVKNSEAEDKKTRMRKFVYSFSINYSGAPLFFLRFPR